jgi:hypothetical protein
MTSKKRIPKVLKDLVWDTTIGKNKGIGECYVCCQEIDSKKFHCGHIVSEKHGGLVELANLKPICATCNLSMGSQNMTEFKQMFFSKQEKLELKPKIKECFFIKLHDYINPTTMFVEDLGDMRYKTLAQAITACQRTIYCKLKTPSYTKIDLNDCFTTTIEQFKTKRDYFGKTYYIICCMKEAMENGEHICDNCKEIQTKMHDTFSS